MIVISYLEHLIIKRIPGFTGYLEKDLRRTSDRIDCI